MRWLRWAVGVGCVCGLVFAGALWAFGRPGYPFGDPRACDGSDVPLRQELDTVGLPLPAGAQDVHYVTHSTAAEGDVVLAVEFRSTSRTMNAYLRDNKLVTKGLDTLADGRFDTGDAGTDPASLGLCGGVPLIHAPAVLVTQQRLATAGYRETIDLALQTGPTDIGRLSATPEVQLMVTHTAL